MTTTCDSDCVRRAATITNSSVGLFSMICLLISFVTIFYLRRKKAKFSPDLHMIISLLISCLFQAVSHVCGFAWVQNGATNGVLCQISGWLASAGNVTITFWEASIATFVAYTLFNYGKYPPVTFYIVCHFFIWSAGIVVASLGFYLKPFGEYYGPIDGNAYCWIQPGEYRLWLGFLWIDVVMVYLFCVYITIAVFLVQHFFKRNSSKSEVTKTTIIKMIGFPIIFFLVWGPPSFVRLISLYRPVTNIPMYANYTVSCIVALNGFTVSMYYGFARKIWTKLKEKCVEVEKIN